MYMEKLSDITGKSIKNDRKIWIVFFMTGVLCLWGGIYDFSVAVYGVFLVAGIIWLGSRNRQLRISVDITAKLLFVMLLCHIISVFFANDKGMAVVGIIRIGVVCLFWMLWCNISVCFREKVWQYIPETASIMTGVSVICYFIPGMKEYVFGGDRLGGFFQYANTCAIFLLLALILLIYRKQKKKLDYVECIILGIGIIFCGSRSVVVIAGIVFIFFLIKGYGNKKVICLVLAIAMIVLLALQMFMHLDIGRLLMLSLNSSTLNGRLLYWRDSLAVIVKRPMGLGYMGYYYLQPQFQTGVYTTKFVHNDFLQYALDAGVICVMALAAIVLKNVFSKSNNRQKRMVILVLTIHCLFDFDLQFLSMFFLMLMCVEPDESRIKLCFSRKIYIGAVMLFICYAYFTTAFGMAQFGRYKESLRLYPLNTDARLAMMQESDDAESAEKLIRQSGMIAEAYECAARHHIESKAYVEAYEDVESMLQCAGYNIYYYNQYVYYLSQCLDQAVRNEDYSNGQVILEAIQDVPKKIDSLKNKTSFFAYRIYDQPSFDLEVEIKAYIERLSNMTLNER